MQLLPTLLGSPVADVRELVKFEVGTWLMARVACQIVVWSDHLEKSINAATAYTTVCLLLLSIVRLSIQPRSRVRRIDYPSFRSWAMEASTAHQMQALATFQVNSIL